MNSFRHAHLYFATIWIVMAIFAAWLLQNETTGQPGFSLRANQSALTTCLREMSGAEARLATNAKRATINQKCADLGQTILSGAAPNAYAWYILAYAKRSENPPEIFNSALENSYRLDPNSLWLAELRIGLAMQSFENLSSKAKTNNLDDLDLLLQSQRGLQYFARLYRDFDQIRKQMVDILESQPFDIQQQFLYLLQQANRGANEG